MQKIQTFKDLIAWQEGHKLVLMVYDATKKFPKTEMYGLVDQMRRASVSITSNIAEGFSRHSYKDKAQFYVMAAGSITELQNQLAISQDVKYLDKKEAGDMLEQSEKTHKILNGLIRSSRKKIGTKILYSLFSILTLYSLFSILTSAPSAHASLANRFPSNTTGLNAGLVGWWTFDGRDMSNGVALDRTANGNNGNLINISTSTFYAPGKLGQGFNFDGVNDYVTASTGTVGNNFTYSFWIKPNNLSSAPVILAGTTAANASAIRFCRIGGNGAGKVNCSVDGTSGGSAVTTTVLKTGTFYHVAYVVTGNVQQIFLNGVNEGSATETSNTSGSFLCIGDGCNTGLYFSGVLDDVRIYNYALSTSTIAELYAMGNNKLNTSSKAFNTPLRQGLTAWWTMDGQDTNWTSDTETDQATGAAASKLRMLNFSTTTSPVPGRIGQALAFNGANTNMNTTGPFTNFMSTATGTMSVWFYANSGNVTGCSNGQMSALITDSDNTGLGGDAYMGYDGTNVCAGANDGSFRTVSSAVPLNAWTHVVWMHKNGVLSLWKNGTFVGATALANITDLSTSVYLGRSYQSPSHSFFNGYLDDVRIYSTALSTSSIQQLYYNGQSKQGITLNRPKSSLQNNALTAWWTFDGKDMANGEVLDRTANGYWLNTENISTTTFYSSGKIGQAVNFTAPNNDLVDNGGAGDPVGTGPVTFCVWLYPYGYGGGNFGRVIDTGSYIVGLETANSGDWYVSSDGASEAPSAPSSVVFNKWTFVCATRDASGIANMYLNGALSGTANQSSGTPAAATHALRIGNRSGLDRAFNGKIDDVRIYDRILSQQEIVELYLAGK